MRWPRREKAAVEVLTTSDACRSCEGSGSVPFESYAPGLAVVPDGKGLARRPTGLTIQCQTCKGTGKKA